MEYVDTGRRGEFELKRGTVTRRGVIAARIMGVHMAYLQAL
jgi:hypothetical protein